jgi:uncharacterized Zn-finger protein
MLIAGTELKIHIKNVHCDDRPFRCDHKGCDSAFKQKENLKEHMLRHTQKKNFVCLVCDKGKLNMMDKPMAIPKIQSNSSILQQFKFEGTSNYPYWKSTHTVSCMWQIILLEAGS